MPVPLLGRYVSAAQLAQLRYHVRIIRRLASSEFKLQYQGSAIGSLWSLLKPTSLFLVLYLVFGRMLHFGSNFKHFPLYLLIGLVLWIFFANATTAALNSVVARGALLRRVAFPPLVIPIAATLTATLSFAFSLVPIAILIVVNGIVPRAEWLLLVFLLLELFIYTVAFSLVLSAMCVKYRDTRQLWDVVGQLLFYLSPVVYPLEQLPAWGQKLIFLNPFTQIMQDVRALVLYDDSSQVTTVREVLRPHFESLIPFLLILFFAIGSVIYFTREQRWFAERV